MRPRGSATWVSNAAPPAGQPFPNAARRPPARAFEFISTTAQIGDIRRFMRTLPDVLSR
jgi:hypothetical protein